MKQRHQKAPPVTSTNKRMSLRHLRDSVEFNKSHAQDHLKAMKDDQKALKKITKMRVKQAKS